jgi:hypothetical protein
MSSSNRNITRGRTQPPPSGFGEGLSSDIRDGAIDDTEPDAGEANASISGSLAGDETRMASGSSADAEPRTASPSFSSTINPSLNPLNPLSSITVATSVGVVRFAAMINHTDLTAEANRFLKNCNIQGKIILASKILIIYIRSLSALCINCKSNKFYFSNCYFVFVKRRQ